MKQAKFEIFKDSYLSYVRKTQDYDGPADGVDFFNTKKQAEKALKNYFRSEIKGYLLAIKLLNRGGVK